MSDDIFNAIAKSKGRDAITAPASVATPFADADAVTRAAQEARAWQNPLPGDVMPDGTVYLGQRTVMLGNGKENLARTFNIYAAAGDMPEETTYAHMAEAVAGLRGLHGHDGVPYKNELTLYHALRTGAYAGTWVIPDRSMFRAGERTLGNMLSPNKKYWCSSSETLIPPSVSTARFNGAGAMIMDAARKRRGLHACRPVRLVEVTP